MRMKSQFQDYYDNNNINTDAVKHLKHVDIYPGSYFRIICMFTPNENLSQIIVTAWLLYLLKTK